MKFLKQDIVASLVVFVVAIPLSLGIALASGASPAAGIISAIIGGILCGLLTGAPLAVSGPAAGLVALVYPMVAEFGIAGLAVITFLAGGLQILMGVGRLGFLFTYVPKAVLEGMLSAIGFIIASLQLHVLLGAPSPKNVVQAFQLLPSALQSAAVPLLICGTLALAIQMAWPHLSKKVSWIPGALPAVLITTFVSLMWAMPRVEISDLKSQLATSYSNFNFSILNDNLVAILIAAVSLAVVASAESLLTALALQGDSKADSQNQTAKPQLNKELFAQGASNMVAGALGGLPITGVIVRSAVNKNSGAQTRLSTILHGVWIAAFVLFLPHVLQKIPLTALAAVLVFTGFKLLNYKGFVNVLKESKWHASLWAVTFSAILLTDLLKGLMAGLVIYFVGEQLRKRISKSTLVTTTEADSVETADTRVA